MATLLAACGQQESSSSTTSNAPGAPTGSLEIIFTYGSEKQSWIESVTPGFNQSQIKSSSGRPIYVSAIPAGSGDCVEEVLSGQRQAHCISPASAVFLKLGNARSMAEKGNPLTLEPVNLVLSPVVIAMWQPMAEKLGWPQRALGWADIHKMSADPQGWAAHGAPQWGRFRFGHTHPDYSNSGLLAVIAEVAASCGKVRDLTAEDVHRPETGDYIRQIESSIVHYGESTGFFGQKMFSGGPEYLSAAVLYENMVIEARSRTGAAELSTPVVAIYPKEGTFWSDHPAAIVNRPWVTPEHADAARKYLDYLSDPARQQSALGFGFRPGNVNVATGPPVDSAHGADASQPQTLLELPDTTVIESIRSLWQANKKAADITLVFDTSGSMQEENKIKFAREGAQDFIRQLGDRDTLSILSFSNRLTWLAQDARLKDQRQTLLQTSASLLPSGGTSLYDAVAAAAARMKSNADPSRIQAIVVLSDGDDQNSSQGLEEVLQSITSGGEQKGVRVFSIAYGKGARRDILEKIAKAARGRAYKGDGADIRKVFRDISIFF